jgi:CRISPR/Cas system CSM-associated protein Csm2 small subunit
VSNGKRQAKKNFTLNELAVLKLQCMMIILAQERKYETKTFHENFAKKLRTCRLPFPET